MAFCRRCRRPRPRGRAVSWARRRDGGEGAAGRSWRPSPLLMSSAKSRGGLLRPDRDDGQDDKYRRNPALPATFRHG